MSGLTDEPRAGPLPPPGAPELALLDRDGVVVWVNEAWSAFGAANGADLTRVGVGASYLAACASSDDAVTRLVVRAVQLAIEGRLLAPFRVLAPCHTPDRRLWFEQLVASRLDDSGHCVGATVTMTQVTPESGPTLTHGLPVLDPTAAWALVELSPDGQLLFDEQGRIVYLNLTMETMSGYSREELAGAAVEKLVPMAVRLDHAQSRADYFASADRRAMATEIAARLVRRDGSELEVDVSLAPIAVGGEPLIACSVRDVSESRDRERRLVETENHFGVSFDHSPIGMAVLEIDESGRGRLVRVNEVLAQILGVPVGMLLGRDLADFRDPVDEPRRAAARGSVLEDAITRRDRIRRYIRPDGTSVWASVFVSLLERPGVGGSIALVHLVDLTSHFEVELLQQRQAALTRLLMSATNDMLSGVPQNEAVTRIVAAAAHVFEADSAAHFVDSGDGNLVQFGPAWRRGGGIADAPPLLEPEVLVGLELEPGLAAGSSAFARYGRPGLPCGVLALTRENRAKAFTEPEVELLTSLAYQLGLTMELFESRADQERLRLVEDRQRLARDLHDSVVQDLIGVGMQLNHGLGTLAEPDHRRRELELVDQIESAVDRLRAMVVHLRRPDSGPSLSSRLRQVVDRATPTLGHVPELVVTGGVDAVPRVVADQVADVVREALSNVARHASASSTRVEVSADRELVRVSVDDDGVGLRYDGEPGHGLDNLQERATSLDGEFSARRSPTGGTSLRWSASVVSPVETMRRYRLDAASSSDVVMEAGADGVLTWVSPAITDLLGWSPEALIGRRGIELAHPDDVATIAAAVIAVDSGRVERGTARMRCADGSYRRVRSVVRPVLDESGNVLYRIIGASAVDGEPQGGEPGFG